MGYCTSSDRLLVNIGDAATAPAAMKPCHHHRIIIITYLT